jgi:hypothetical protein
MKLLLITDEGRQLACIDDLPNGEDRNPAQVFALLDILERILETGWRDCAEAKLGSLPVADPAAP